MPVRVLVHFRIVCRGLRSDRAPAKVHAIPKTEGLFTVGIECRKGSLPETLDRTSPVRNRDYGFATKSARAFVSEG